MIIAFIIALCLNKCKLQAYVQGNKKKKKVEHFCQSEKAMRFGLLWYKLKFRLTSMAYD